MPTIHRHTAIQLTQSASKSVVVKLHRDPDEENKIKTITDYKREFKNCGDCGIPGVGV